MLDAGISSHSCTMAVRFHVLKFLTLSISRVSYAGETSACASGALLEQQMFGVHESTPSAVKPVALAMFGFLVSTLCADTA
jgi:hypothetical protein